MRKRISVYRLRIYLLSGLMYLGLLGLVSTAAAQKIAERSTSELLRVAQTLYGQKECFSSRYLYQEVLRREPENVAALSGKGQALVCEGSFAEGVSTLEQATELAPDRGQGYVQLAEAYVEQYNSDPQNQAGRLDDALSALREAEAAGADEGAISNLRGVVLYRQQKLPEARDALIRATEQRGDVADYQRNLGLVYLRLGNNEAAVTTLRRAVSLEPEDPLGHNQLGQAYLLLGRCEDAIFELEQAVTLAPNVAEVNFNAGQANFTCDNLEQARRYFDKVVSLEPTAFPPAYTYLARIELEAENFDTAVTQATKGALLPPTNAEAYYWLGQMYEARGGEAEDAEDDLGKARGAYERALELDPAFEPAQEALEALDNP